MVVTFINSINGLRSFRSYRRFAKTLSPGLNGCSVLVGKDYDGFLHEIMIATILIIGKSVILSTTTYTSNILYVSWRQLLSQSVHRLYFSENRYYKLNVLDLTIDNPDQRITQDIDKMCDRMSNIFVKIIISPLTISYYTYKTALATGYIGPISVFVFFILSTVVNKVLMSPVSKFYAEREKKEGNFRFKHMYVRVNSESIAFHESERTELLKSNRKLNELTKVLQSLYNREFPLNVSVNFFNYFSAIISYIVIAIPLFDGAFDGMVASDLTALISANAFITIYLVFQFSLFISLSVEVSELAGTTHRISQLIEKLTSLCDDQLEIFKYSDNDADRQKLFSQHTKKTYGSQDLSNFKTKDEMESNWFCKLQNVTIFPPGLCTSETIPLVTNLSVEIIQGQNILITGNSSSGKTSLLRVIRGLWPSFSGSISRSSHIVSSPSSVMYLPQKPLLTDGSIRDLIIYPLHSLEEIDDKEENKKINRWIEITELNSLVNRYNGIDVAISADWYDVLSPGEMQRISFLRLFYHRPCFAFIDEATAAISIDMEEILYEECQRLGITVISVGHRPSIQKYHNMKLNIAGQGEWSLEKLN
ncbi:ATP-binding cassette sub-family D member 4 [Nymphon striatum]|nr:ATP-binding cassette sub-family D member 4 [Nymphon striatum]